MSGPSAQNYLDLAAWTYDSGMTPGTPDGDYTAFAVNGRHYFSNNNFDAYAPGAGFYAAAYSIGSGSNESVVIGFEGTNTSVISTQPVFALNEVKADYQLYEGQLPTALELAARFTQAVIRTAAAEGISKSNIYITGHSLGGAEAEYADAVTGLTGVTYGAPGIASGDIPAGSTSGLTNYVERGDPVGNYAYTGPSSPEGAFIYSDTIGHVGTTQYLGSRSDALPLRAAGLAWGSGTLVGKAGALGAFLSAAETYHPLGVYARSLGLSDTSAPPGATSIDPAGLASLVTAIAGQDGGTPSIPSALGTPPAGGIGSLVAGIASEIPNALFGHGSRLI